MYERIWNLAKAQGISIPALEEIVGVSQSTIGKWKHSIPKVDAVYRVAQVLHTTVEYLYTGRVYLFSGLLVCSCGRNLVGNCNTTYSPGKQYRYRCAGCYRDHLCSNNKYLIESEIEDFLLAKVCQEIDKMSAQVEYSAPAPKPIDNTGKLERLTELYIEGEISKEEYQKRKDALTVIPEIKQLTPRIKEIALSGDDLRESYQFFTRQERRAVWKSVIDRIDVDGDALTVTFRA